MLTPESDEGELLKECREPGELGAVGPQLAAVPAIHGSFWAQEGLEDQNPLAQQVSPKSTSRIAWRGHPVADPTLGKDVGWVGRVIVQFAAEHLDEGA